MGRGREEHEGAESHWQLPNPPKQGWTPCPGPIHPHRHRSPPYLHLLLIQDLHEAIIFILRHGGGQGAPAQYDGAISLGEIFLLGGVELERT